MKSLRKGRALVNIHSLRPFDSVRPKGDAWSAEGWSQALLLFLLCSALCSNKRVHQLIRSLSTERAWSCSVFGISSWSVRWRGQWSMAQMRAYTYIHCLWCLSQRLHFHIQQSVHSLSNFCCRLGTFLKMSWNPFVPLLNLYKTALVSLKKSAN